MTFSLVARDAATGAFGMVVTSSSPSVAARCVHLRPGTGAVASRNTPIPGLGAKLLDLLGSGSSAGGGAGQALLCAQEPDTEYRQLTAVGRDGRTAAFSGARTLGSPSHRTVELDGAVAAGNLLATAAVSTPWPRPSPWHDAESRGAAARRPPGRPRAPAARQGPEHSAGLAVVGGRPLGGRPTCGWTGADEDPSPSSPACSELWRPQKRDYTAARRAAVPRPPATGCRGTCEKPQGRGRRPASTPCPTGILGLSHRIHANPEPGWQEHQAAGWFTAELRAVSATTSPGHSADSRRRFPPRVGRGPLRLALCAEYDALPGLGHACGHNIIAAASVGAALAWPRSPTTSASRSSVLGTPAEEGGGGKIELLDAAPSTASHAAHDGPPGAAGRRASRAVRRLALPGPLPRQGAPTPPRTRSVGSTPPTRSPWPRWPSACCASSCRPVTGSTACVTNGGEAPNAIPETTEGRWYVRAGRWPTWTSSRNACVRCFEAGALATGCDLRHRGRTASPTRSSAPTRPCWRATWTMPALGRTLRRLRSGHADEPGLHRHGERLAGAAGHPPLHRHRLAAGGQPPEGIRRALRGRPRRTARSWTRPRPWPGPASTPRRTRACAGA